MDLIHSPESPEIFCKILWIYVDGNSSGESIRRFMSQKRLSHGVRSVYLQSDEFCMKIVCIYDCGQLDQ